MKSTPPAKPRFCAAGPAEQPRLMTAHVAGALRQCWSVLDAATGAPREAAKMGRPGSDSTQWNRGNDAKTLILFYYFSITRRSRRDRTYEKRAPVRVWRDISRAEYGKEFSKYFRWSEPTEFSRCIGFRHFFVFTRPPRETGYPETVSE